MITKFGKRFITSYLASGLNFNQKDIAIGIGSQAPTVNDSDMQFEFYRSGVFLGSSDIQTNTASGVTTYSVVYKTTLPTDVEGIISEIGHNRLERFRWRTTNICINTNSKNRFLIFFYYRSKQSIKII